MGFKNILFGWKKFDIQHSDLVLDVGSGNRPFSRSDVLCDLGDYGEEERYGGSILKETVMDRPFVFCDAHRLPFRDNSFDFLINSHTIEHLKRPDIFLMEACRVSKRGCIIAPSEIFELMFDEPTHRWFISHLKGRLKIRAKTQEYHGPFSNLFRNLWAENSQLRKFVLARSDVFEVCFPYSDGKIDFEIDGINAVPYESEPDVGEEVRSNISRLSKSKILSVFGSTQRCFLSGRKVDLNTLLACPLCGGDVTFKNESFAKCHGCGKQYPLRNNRFPVMLSSEAE